MLPDVATALARSPAGQQKDNLCGPFWAARLLADAGFERWDGEELDEDLVALRAGTLLPEPDHGSVPSGAESRTGYRFELPRVEPARSGTAAGALAEAIERASGALLRCVPVRGRWTEERVAELVDRAGGARLLANVRTGAFWGSRPTVDALLAELRGERVEGPPADWDVGHFCELELLLRGPGGALVLVHDSYPSLGWGGRHLQPPRAVAAALLRGDGREGGVLAVAPPEDSGRLEGLTAELGLEVGVWDNGTSPA
jgi:hypothetical protein